MLRLTLAFALTAMVAAASPAQQPRKKTEQSTPEQQTPAAAVVKLIKTAAATDISLAIDDPKLAQLVHLEAIESAKALKITATQLYGPETVTLTCTVNGKPCEAGIAVTKGELVPLSLRADLNRAGKYAGVLTVQSGTAAPLRLTITVTKTDAHFPLALLSADAVTLADAEPAMIRVSVQEKSGLRQTLNRPEMIVLSRREPGVKGKAAVASFKAVPLLTETVDMGKIWDVPAYAASSFLMRVNLPDAGEYTGTIRLTSPSTPAALNIPVTVWVRESAGFAAFLITVGVLFSFILRTYLGKGRARLLQQQETMQLLADVRRLREEVQKTYTTEDRVETVVFDTFMQRITALSEELDIGNVENAAATLTELRARVTMIREWVVLRRRIAGLSAETGQKLEPDLEKVTAFLRGDTGTDLESVRTTLRDLPAKIDKEIQAELATRIAALGKKVEDSTFVEDPALRATLREEVKKHLDAAAAHSRTKRFEDAAAALLGAEAAFAAAIGTELVRRMKAETNPPIGFDESTWPALRKQIEDMLPAAGGDPAERIRMVRTAFRTYTEGQAAALETFARKRLRPRIDEESDVSKKASLDAAYDAAVKFLSTARQAAQAEDFDKASLDLGNAVKNLREIDSKAPGGSSLSIPAQTMDFADGTAPVVPSLDISGLLFNILGGMGTRDSRFAQKRAEYLKKLIKRLDWVVLLAVLGAAIVLGLKLLWSDNLMWGSFSDYMVALLWGLGLHQVTSSTVNGLGGVLSTVST